MTIEQKKISLINWITNLDDETMLDKMTELRQSSLDELPDAIVKLLRMADEESDEKLTLYTSAKDVLKS